MDDLMNLDQCKIDPLAFQNFLLNSMRVYDKKLVGQVWDLISAEIAKVYGNLSCKPCLKCWSEVNPVGLAGPWNGSISAGKMAKLIGGGIHCCQGLPLIMSVMFVLC